MSNPTEFPEPTLVAVNGVELEVFEAGRENVGNPIVLCHGWPEHAYSWRHQMPALAAAGYHVIVPNQRGYGNSSRPTDVTDYDIEHLSGDLVGLLDHYGYDDATFVGHDWGAMVVWWLTLLHPSRVKRLINLSVPYQDRGEQPWIEWMEAVFGGDFYFVHFNRQPGVADAVMDQNVTRFLRNMYRKNLPLVAPEPGMMMINLARAETPLGDPVMSDDDLAVFVSAFESTGFTGSINWYRATSYPTWKWSPWTAVIGSSKKSRKKRQERSWPGSNARVHPRCPEDPGTNGATRHPVRHGRHA